VTGLAATVAIDVVAWAAISATAGYVGHRLPAACFEHDGSLTRRRAGEVIQTYERTLRIKRWKDRLPEAGALFRGGFRKRELATGDRAHLERFVVETRRAEHVHWWILVTGPLFLLWNPWWLGLAMVAYALAANIPCIAVQRYNRLRLQRALGRPGRAGGHATTSVADRGSPPVPS
jgi:glycosyl-4,4'-diaponeurosporenoate acyltransferase